MQNSLFKNNRINISPETQSLAEKEGLEDLCKVYPVWKSGTGFWPRGLAIWFYLRKKTNLPDISVGSDRKSPGRHRSLAYSST